MDVGLLLKQIGALLLVPVILIVGMGFVVVFHDLLILVLSGIGIQEVFGMDFLVSVISLGAFAALCWFIYWWVGQGGPGILS